MILKQAQGTPAGDIFLPVHCPFVIRGTFLYSRHEDF